MGSGSKRSGMNCTHRCTYISNQNGCPHKIEQATQPNRSRTGASVFHFFMWDKLQRCLETYRHYFPKLTSESEGVAGRRLTKDARSFVTSRFFAAIAVPLAIIVNLVFVFLLVAKRQQFTTATGYFFGSMVAANLLLCLSLAAWFGLTLKIEWYYGADQLGHGCYSSTG